MDRTEIIEYLNLSDDDLKWLENNGISSDSLSAQVDLFKNGVPFINIVRPCSIGDGIISLKDDKTADLMKLHNEACEKGRLMKFVPASGAATRMFKDLIFVHNHHSNISLETLNKNKHLPEYKSVQKTIDNLEKFAFFDDLKDALNEDGYDINELLTEGRYKIVLDYMLYKPGLSLAKIAKGITKFHKYSNEERSAIEEHIIESIKYIKPNDGAIKIHFTISEDNYQEISKFILRISDAYRDSGININIEFSVQKKSTDSISIFSNSEIVRDNKDNIIRRPGGHGALLENLNDIKGDIIFIKNIDNVAPESKLDDTIKFKKLLCGFLIGFQNKVFDFLKRVESKCVSSEDLKNILNFFSETVHYKLPANIKRKSIDEQLKYLFERLNRPIRVCGMVKNEGEPGGGPFWVNDYKEEFSCQIVESVQIDPNSNSSKEAFQSATHFNPVDLVCGVKNFKGRNFDLLKYRDLKTAILTAKSFKGRTIKVIELPGLWNGGMSNWFSIFIEVPLSTFNPVKKINDLLKTAHRV